MHGQALEPVRERVLLQAALCRRGHRYSACGWAWASGSAAFTACPPNWLRSAAFTLAAKAFWPREEKRSNSEVVITGVGIRLSIESSTVQRPSPESST